MNETCDVCFTRFFVQLIAIVNANKYKLNKNKNKNKGHVKPGMPTSIWMAATMQVEPFSATLLIWPIGVMLSAESSS